VEFQAGDTGTQSPDDYPAVEITLDSWTASPADPHTVNFTISGLSAGQNVDISVKSGTHVQETGPYGNGSHSFSNGIQNGISHIRLCVFEEPPPPQPGEIIVVKEVTAGSDTSQAFTFNTTGFTLGDNSLADGESSSSGDIPAGNYGVSEVVPAGWNLVGAVCDDDSDPDDIDVSEGETVTCTFTNEEVPPEPGEIVVVKEVTAGSDTSVAFTFNAAGFTLGDNTLADGESSSSGDIPAGDGYSVSEELPPGWIQVSATCDDGSPVDNISVGEGETVTCTFVNEIEDLVAASILVTGASP
jgi:hypothetical protein